MKMDSTLYSPSYENSFALIIGINIYGSSEFSVGTPNMLWPMKDLSIKLAWRLWHWFYDDFIVLILAYRASLAGLRRTASEDPSSLGNLLRLSPQGIAVLLINIQWGKLYFHPNYYIWVKGNHNMLGAPTVNPEAAYFFNRRQSYQNSPPCLAIAYATASQEFW